MMVTRQPAFDLVRSCVLGVLLSTLGLLPRLMAGDGVDPLILQLTSSNPFARLVAAGKVAEQGPSAAAAVPALIDALKCEQIDVLFESPQIAAGRQQFADALIRIGEPAIPKLQQGLTDESDLVRVWSACALAKIDPERQRARVIPVLIDAVRQEGEAASDAATILESMGAEGASAIPVLIQQLGNPDLTVRCGVAHALVAIARGDRSRPLVAALQHADPLVRVGAAFAVLRLEADSSKAPLGVIAEALRNESAEVRRQAVWAIGQLGVAAEPLAGDLVDALTKLEPNPAEYFFGGGALGKLSTDPSLVLAAIGPGARPRLIEALDNDQPKARLMAAIALLRLDRSQAARVAPILKAGRTETDQGLRFLAELNAAPADPSEAPDLEGLIQEVLQGNGFGPPSPAMGQLIRRGGEAVEPLMKVLKSGDGLAAGRIGSVLAAIGAPALPALSEALRSGDDRLRVFAATALAGMGEPAVPELVRALNDELYPVRRAARYALRSIGTAEALDALRSSAGDQ